MYDPHAVNDFANWLVIVAALPFVLSTLVYGILAPWYRTLLGTTLFGLLFSISSVLIFVFTRRVWGEYWGYEILANAIYGMLLVFASAFLAILIVERGRAGLLTFSIRRRERKVKS